MGRLVPYVDSTSVGVGWLLRSDKKYDGGDGTRLKVLWDGQDACVEGVGILINYFYVELRSLPS